MARFLRWAGKAHKSPLFVACAAAAVYAGVIGACLNVGSGFSFWGASAVDWIDALGSAGAAIAAVWLGLMAVNRERKTDAGRARLVAYIVLRELDGALLMLRDLVPGESEEDQFAFVVRTQSGDGLKSIAPRADSARLRTTKDHLYELTSFPLDLGFHVASAVPFVDHVADELARARSVDQGERFRIAYGLGDRVKANLPQLELILLAVKAVAEDRLGDLEGLLSEIEKEEKRAREAIAALLREEAAAMAPIVVEPTPNPGFEE